MIKYDRLWETMKARGVTQYDLYTHHNVNRSQINAVEDIMEHIPDDNKF